MGFLEDRDLNSVCSIPEFYKGKTIFMTGGSGFMGKALIEKLLYSCSDLDRIYLLLRSKKDVEPEQRLDDLYNSPCFDRLRNEKPEIFKEKVFFIAGNVSEIGLGLSEEDRALLVNRVNIIFHAAASVRFDDSLPAAVKLNLRGTREIVELASDMHNLLSLVHVSTSYSNTNQDPIEEVLYPPHADWGDTIKVCESLDEELLKIFTPKYLGELPNTYVFTKQLAEHVVFEQKGKLPVVIVRPSIVISSHLEPMPGWIDNFNGPAGLLIGSGKGVIRTVYSNPDLISDYIPVDVAIKSFVAAGWIRGTKILEPTDGIPIYHCCAGKLNCLTNLEVYEYGHRAMESVPLNDMICNNGGTINSSKIIYTIKVYLLQLLPALLIDTVLWLLGKKPLLFKIQRRIYTANMALQYFLTRQFNFSNTNLIKLRSSLKLEDISDFYYDIEKIDVFEYYKMCCLGGRRYLLKEKDEDLPKAKAQLKRAIILDKVIEITIYGLIFWMVITSEYTRFLFDKFKNLIY